MPSARTPRKPRPRSFSKSFAGACTTRLAPVLEFGCFEVPAIDAVHRGGVRRDHASNRVADWPVPSEGENHAAVDGYVGHFRVERNIVHVDEMLPERID